MDYEVKDFQQDVIEESLRIPVLVDFWAEWCGPCKALSPILEKLAVENPDRFKLVKVNTDLNEELAYQFQIRSIPLVILFVDGDVKDTFMGALPQKQIEAFLDKNIPKKAMKQIDMALEYLNSGDIRSAEKLLLHLAEKENDPRAKVHLARILMFNEPDKAAAFLEGLEPQREDLELFNALTTIGTLLKDQSRLQDMPEAVVKKNYVAAFDAVMQQQFERALELFIDCIREDRYYDDDGARKACIAVFKYLGEENPITLKYRRPFGSALYI